MVTGILVTHGPIGDALVTAARNIVGRVESVETFSVTGLSLEHIHRRLQAILDDRAGEEGVVIFASLKGGSCWNAAARAVRGRKNVYVVSGVNLPMLLSFVTKRQLLPLPDLVATLVTDGSRGIAALGASS